MVEQKFGNGAMAFPHREVNRRRVVVLDRREQPSALYELLYCVDVTVPRGDEHLKHIVRGYLRAVGECPLTTRRQFDGTHEWS